jgi:hypothetical protein
MPAFAQQHVAKIYFQRILLADCYEIARLREALNEIMRNPKK